MIVSTPVPDLSVLAREGGAPSDAKGGPAARNRPDARGHSAPTDSIPQPLFRWKTRVLLPAGVLGLFALLLLYAARDTLLPATPVRVTAVVPGVGGASSASPAFQAAGWIEPDPYPIFVSALADGVVKEVPVLEGQRVKKGDVVVRMIDDDAKLALARAEAEVGQREAEVQSAQAALAAAQREWDNPVERDKAVAVATAALAGAEAELHANRSQVDLEQARLDEIAEQYRREKTAGGDAIPEIQIVQTGLKLKTQQAALDIAKKQQPVLEARVRQMQAELLAAQENRKLRIPEKRALDEARANAARAQAMLETAQVMRGEARLLLERMVVRAPVDGAVYSRRAAPGSKLMLRMDDEASARAVTLYDPEKLQVRVDVPLAEAGRVSVGQKAQVTVEVLRDKVFNGIVTRITNEADIQKNTLQVKVRIEDPAPELKPEMLARVQFIGLAGKGGETASAMRVFVPEAALRKDGNSVSTWIVDKGHGTALKRAVSLGSARREGWVEVVAGLQPGDSVIVGDTAMLREGQRVRVIESGGAGFPEKNEKDGMEGMAGMAGMEGMKNKEGGGHGAH